MCVIQAICDASQTQTTSRTVSEITNEATRMIHATSDKQ